MYIVYSYLNFLCSFSRDYFKFYNIKYSSSSGHAYVTDSTDSLSPSIPNILASLLDAIQYLHRDDECKSLLVGQH